MDDREEFLATIRQALGRSPGEPPGPSRVSALSSSGQELEQRVQEIKKRSEERAADLAGQLEEKASQAGWRVARVGSEEEACQYVKELALSKKAKLVLRSAQRVLGRLSLERTLTEVGIEAKVMALDEEAEGAGREEKRLLLRQEVIRADIGVTGVDYAISETGTCVLIPRKGISRLISVAPPVHVAVVEKGQIVETADDLLTLRRQEFMETGDLGSYMNFITGPSSTADIEQTITIGVHGPKEVHIIILA